MKKEIKYEEYLEAIDYLYNLKDEGYKPTDKICNAIIKFADKTKRRVNATIFINNIIEANNEISSELKKIETYKTANKLQKYYYRNRKIYYNAITLFIDETKEFTKEWINAGKDIINIYNKSQEVKWKMKIEKQRKEKQMKKLNNKEL